MLAAIALAKEVIALLPALIQLGADVSELISKTRAVLDSTSGPGDADWDALDAKIKDLQAQLNADP